MLELLDAVTALISQVKPDKVRSLAESIRKCGNADDNGLLRDWANTSQLRHYLDKLRKSWKQSSVSSAELAGMLVGASSAYHAAKAEETTELVWTGPSSPLMSARRTEQALLEVIQSARESLFLVSFIAYEVGSITHALNAAIQRGVKVFILMESAESEGGKAKDDCFASMKYAVPGATLYLWSNENKEAEGGGYRLVHAKCSVADGKIAFITSANLTGAALERNMELGVLIRGEHIPRQLFEHLRVLMTTKVIVPYV